jgi:hypothetical protein
MQLLSPEGIFAQPASATALAGLIKAVNKNLRIQLFSFGHNRCNWVILKLKRIYGY